MYRALRVNPDSSMTWKVYATAVLVLGLLSTLLLYLILRLQGVLPLNPAHAPGMSPLLSFNTAISFITGTNWQAYEGETQASYLADMAGLVVAQFTAAAVGLAVALAVVRGIAGSSRRIGNFWADVTRSLVRVFVPLSVLGALVLVSQGAVQNFSGFRTAVDAGRRHPADPRRPGRLDGGHQAARHQRRQHVRRGRRPPVREPHRLHQPLRPAAGHRRCRSRSCSCSAGSSAAAGRPS